MLDVAIPPLPTAERPVTPPKTVIRACRPALTDLRFKGDACVVGEEEGAVASVCLGDYRMVQLEVTPFDLPSLNSTLWQVRVGQARLNQSRRK